MILDYSLEIPSFLRRFENAELVQKARHKPSPQASNAQKGRPYKPYREIQIFGCNGYLWGNQNWK